jgi:inorganic pyrophosphatase
VGAANSLEFRLFLEDSSSGKIISPFHDIPLWVNKEEGIVNMFVEISRWTNAKLEICKEELMNPIRQDVKKGALRFVKNIFPYHGYPWNYGALPQTWECPDVTDQATGCRGDNDPIDAVEIGSEVLPTGTVKAVKILGVMGLIDEGETDWKILVIDVNDPLSSKLHDITDVSTHCPELLNSTHQWFRDYKVPDGKGKNEFAFNGEFRDKAFALSIVNETHETWLKLITGQIANKGIALANRQSDNPNRITPDVEQVLPNKICPIPDPCPVDPAVDKQVYVL